MLTELNVLVADKRKFMLSLYRKMLTEIEIEIEKMTLDNIEIHMSFHFGKDSSFESTIFSIDRKSFHMGMKDNLTVNFYDFYDKDELNSNVEELINCLKKDDFELLKKRYRNW